jgi:CheY-like chemotaxis protein
MMILCIDDDSDDLELFKDCLDMIDPSIQLLVAQNGEEAFALLQHHKPDYIFLDDGMPKMNGRDFLLELKEQHSQLDIPIIVCSTELSSYARRDYDQLNLVKTFIKKPASLNGLCEAIRSAIQR